LLAGDLADPVNIRHFARVFRLVLAPQALLLPVQLGLLMSDLLLLHHDLFFAFYLPDLLLKLPFLLQELSLLLECLFAPQSLGPLVPDGFFLFFELIAQPPLLGLLGVSHGLAGALQLRQSQPLQLLDLLFLLQVLRVLLLLFPVQSFLLEPLLLLKEGQLRVFFFLGADLLDTLDAVEGLKAPQVARLVFLGTENHRGVRSVQRRTARVQGLGLNYHI